MLNIIFSKYNLDYELDMLPWKRCLRELKYGTYDMTLSTSLNDERKATFLVAKHNYTITPSYFYLKKQFPNGVDINNSNQLLKYGRVCGRHGYNYTNFGIDNKKIYRESKTYKASFGMLRKQRCDILLARYEIISGFPLVKGDYFGVVT